MFHDFVLACFTMKNLRIVCTVLTVLMLCAPGLVSAQEDEGEAAAAAEKKQGKTPIQWAAGLRLSSNGIGVDVSSDILNMKGIVTRFSCASLPLSLSVPYTFSGHDLIVDAKARLGYVGLMFDFLPTKNPAFKVTLGLAYMLTRFEGVARFKDDQLVGDTYMLKKDEVGTINAVVTTNPFAPYAGLGWGRNFPRKRLGLGVELGTFYHGAPKLDF